MFRGQSHCWQNSHFSTDVIVYFNFGCNIETDPGFPVGGCPRYEGGHQLSTWLHFINFVCQNERIGTLRGRAPGAPPLDPTQRKISIPTCTNWKSYMELRTFTWRSDPLDITAYRLLLWLFPQFYESLFTLIFLQTFLLGVCVVLYIAVLSR